ncbi:MAG: hypothetical protein PUP91_32275 [Rhizonema sp. PD37]|nr:hypothetical protein [Rhizonema sp. PD37]
MRKSQIIFVLIAALCATNIKPEPVLADFITSPACKDVPSCVVAGTVVIGGIVYYVIKNTVTRQVFKVPVKQRQNPTGTILHHEIGDVLELTGFVTTLRQCQAKALAYGEKNGGLWGVEELKSTGVASPEADVSGGAQYICKIKRIA